MDSTQEAHRLLNALVFEANSRYAQQLSVISKSITVLTQNCIKQKKESARACTSRYGQVWNILAPATAIESYQRCVKNHNAEEVVKGCLERLKV